MKFSFLAALLFLLVSCTNELDPSTPLLHYVPENSFLIVKIENHKAFQNTLAQNDFIADLSKSEIYKKIHAKVQYLRYLSPKSSSILALSETVESTFEFIYVTDNVADLIDLDSIQNKTFESLDKGNSTFDKYTINGNSFFTLVTNSKTIISSSESLLQRFAQNPVTGKHPETLQKLFNATNKNKPASVFINVNNSNTLLSTVAKENSEIQVTGFSDWISFDINNNQKNLNFSGASIANDTIWNHVDLLANTNPTSNKTALFAPSHANAILSYSFDNYEAFAKNRELSSGIVAPIDPPMNSVEEIGIIYLNGEKAVILNTYGAEGISEFLVGQKKATIAYQGQEILQLERGSFLNNRFSPIIENYDANFCVLLKDAFVFSSTLDVLKTIIRSYKNVSTFNKTAVFNTLDKEIAKESSILFISNSKKIKDIVKNNFSEKFTNDLNKVQLSKYGLAAQAIVDNNLYHTNIVIQKLKNEVTANTNDSKLFSVNFDSELATNPQFVTSHLTGNKEVVVQDQNNVLYLISNKGKVLWKKQLSSLIQGEVKQVDIFKNGRLQLAFTTNNQFLVLDRNGKEVKKFTKTYKGGNLNPLAIFDYDNKKNYRFVVTQREKTFMYDNKATIVKGFKYTQAEQPIIAAPKHLVIDNKDYLVFKLKDGSLKLLSRVGDARISVSEKIDFSENEVFKYKNKFTTTDKAGVMYQVDTKGKLTKTNFNFSSDHGMQATDNNLALLNDNILTINGKKVELDLGVYTPPNIFYLNRKIYISVTDLQNEKVYLFDSQAKAVKNFPIDGNSEIDLDALDSTKNPSLLVKENSNTITIYKI